MNTDLRPIVFERILKAKPWGGHALARRLNLAVEPHEPIGESWEIADLPRNESVVRDGRLRGASIRTLMRQWGDALVPAAQRVDDRFPLLIKYLDARENLSVQVHPRPRPDLPETQQPDVKHEAWYVVDAAPGAVMYVGLRDGVTPEQMQSAANTPRSAELLQPREVRPGDCLVLPSGTPHALGGGILVAEIQTPSDVTYRLYDWDRVGLDGRPRELHIEQALANIRYDVPEHEIIQPRRDGRAWIGSSQRIATLRRFAVDLIVTNDPVSRRVESPGLTIWMLLEGSCTVSLNDSPLEFNRGDTILFPAGCPAAQVSLSASAQVLHITLPDAADE
ncbi:MAG: hypothetical protein D6744_15025 [Planctomycetota bacterium]|nr:MAG: hypothetical protein D6744_15025 [Planctomycetota bacterium]